MGTLKTLMEKNLKLKNEAKIGINKIENFLNSKEVIDILVSAYVSSNRHIEIKKRNKLRKIKFKSFFQNGSVGYKIYVSSLGFEAFTGIFYLNKNIRLHTFRIVEEIYNYDLLLEDLKKIIGIEGK